MTITKNQVFTYHNERSCLNEVKYHVIRVGSKKTTLAPVDGQAQLIGLPTFRQPFNIATDDLIAGIEDNIYTINQ